MSMSMSVCFLRITMGRKLLFLVVILMLALVESSRALTLCDINDDGLMACKPSVTKPDPVAPSTICCKALGAANLTCLCSYKTSPLLPALGIDPDLAMELPPKCNLPLPADCQQG